MLDGMSPKDFKQSLNDFEEERKILCFNILRLFGDLIKALQMSSIIEAILHNRFNRGIVAAGGLTSSSINLY